MDHAEIHRAGLSGGGVIVPGGEPLTIEQLRKMDGWPVWVTPAGFWALVIAKKGKRVELVCNDGESVYADKEIELVGPVYAYPPTRIDWEAWDDCPVCSRYKSLLFWGYRTRHAAMDLSGKIHPHISGGAIFCPRCGKPRTPSAWDTLKKRIGGLIK